jgi:NIPSNAP protein
MKHCVEIRSYNLKPGVRDKFHHLVIKEAGPMLQRWKVDVVDYGPSPHDSDSYYLIRCYPSLEARQQSQDAFYGSAEWRDGPRDSILALIENYATIVLYLDDDAIQRMRRGPA